MKNVEKHISKFLVSVAIFLVFGHVAFASEFFSERDVAVSVSSLKGDNQKHPFVYNEISVGESSQTVSKNEYSGLGIFGVVASENQVVNSRLSFSYNSSFSLKDKRKLIFRHLFPFHFFW